MLLDSIFAVAALLSHSKPGCRRRNAAIRTSVAGRRASSSSTKATGLVMAVALHPNWLRPVTPFVLDVPDVPDYRYCCMETIVL